MEQVREAGAELDAAELRALATRRVELLVAEAAVGLELDVLRAAEPPEAPSAPQPIRNAVLAVGASLVIAVLLALARGHLRPRPTARELSQLLDAPILARLPESPHRIPLRRTPPTAGRHTERWRRSCDSRCRRAAGTACS